ncbi:MAG: ribosome small subunit-dependent GTPase A [Clostridia bacterium]|nr:ribosome small subunit-dependent GTPase A [Clostridia bacterium]
MIENKEGKVVKGLGGLYEIRLWDGERISCRAKGALRRDEDKVLIGDNVTVRIDSDTQGSVVISEIHPRKNSLIRPPMANLDYLFIVMASAKPAPVLETVDKLISIAEYNNIKVALVITKNDLGAEEAQRLKGIYERSGYPAFVTGSYDTEGVRELSAYIDSHVREGRSAAFAGASGVGKSTLLNALFPTLSLATSEISRKIERGRHTTRHVEIFALSDTHDTGFFADTPGFSLLDFARFDFMPMEALLSTFPDVARYADGCRFADCAHLGEGITECSVARAAHEGTLEPTRLDSYRSILRVLKSKNRYE